MTLAQLKAYNFMCTRCKTPKPMNVGRKKALRKGLIEMVPGEMARAASSHGSFKPLYRRGHGALA